MGVAIQVAKKARCSQAADVNKIKQLSESHLPVPSECAMVSPPGVDHKFRVRLGQESDSLAVQIL